MVVITGHGRGDADPRAAICRFDLNRPVPCCRLSSAFTKNCLVSSAPIEVEPKKRAEAMTASVNDWANCCCNTVSKTMTRLCKLHSPPRCPLGSVPCIRVTRGPCAEFRPWHRRSCASLAIGSRARALPRTWTAAYSRCSSTWMSFARPMCCYSTSPQAARERNSDSVSCR